MTDLRNKSVLATIIHAPSLGDLEFIENALISIDSAGKISSLHQPSDDDYEHAIETAKSENTLMQVSVDQYLIPGFVDLHIHAPQWPQLGKALDVPLEVWLQEYTFPLEARYSDTDFAERIYQDLVKSLLANGTTTAVYFGTIHQQANQRLADICHALGQRAVVGKVAMDDPSQCPEYYRDASAQESISGTRDFIDYVKAIPGNEDGRVAPAITPRFIPSCSDEALTGLGKLAQETGCHVQTHCSESDWEHNYVVERTGKTDTQALKDFGLLTRKTVLAHSNHIRDLDMETIKTVGSGVAHCPLSNHYFSDAVFPLRRALDKGVRVGLGTDISGGPSASLLENCRTAISASRALEQGVDPEIPKGERGTPNSRIDFREAFFLATAGGADVLDIPTGRLEVGRHFDALLIDAAAEAAPITIDPSFDSPDDIAQKLIMLCSRANISKTWVGGVVV